MTMKVDGTAGVTYPDLSVQATAAAGGTGGGATTNAVSSSAITLTSSSKQYQVTQISSYANSYVVLPDATTMPTLGANPFVIENRSPLGANLELRNAAGATVGYIPIGQIGTVQLKNKDTAAGEWVVETVNPQTFFKYDGASITGATTSPLSNSGSSGYYTYGIVGLSATTFVRWWGYSSAANGYQYIYTQVGTISGSTITFGSTQSQLISNGAAESRIQVVRLNNTTFVYQSNTYSSYYDPCTGITTWGMYVRVCAATVSGTTVTFGSPTATSMPAPTINSTTAGGSNGIFHCLNNGVICRVSDTAFALLYNSSYTTSYAFPYGYAGSMACQIVSVSGTTLTVGTQVTLGTSTYTQAISAVALSSTTVILSYAQATAAGGSSGRTKLVVISVSGTTPTFNTPVSCETSDVLCFGYSLTDGAVAPSAAQVIFNSGYGMGEATISGTTPTCDGFPYSAGQLSPLFLCTASRLWGGGYYAGGRGSGAVYFDIGANGFIPRSNPVHMLQSNLTVSSAVPLAGLGVQPTTGFVAYKGQTQPPFTANAVLILGTTT